MTGKGQDLQGDTSSSPPAGSATVANGHNGDRPPDVSQPRIIEERPVTDSHGETDIEAIDDRGRRWYHLRPEPRRRVDVMGVNYSLRFAIIIAIVVFVPWGWWY
jgi:hypothetical protein